MLATRDDRQAWVKEHELDELERAPGKRRWLVAPIVGPLIERLSRGAIGWCNATAGALRIMAFVDTGYRYGAGSIQRFINREVERGRLRHKRIPSGAYFCRTKRWTANGTQLNRYELEAERRERLWREKTERRKQRAARARLRDDEARRAREGRRGARPTSTPAHALERPPAEPLEMGPSRWCGLLEATRPGTLDVVASSNTLSADDHSANWRDRVDEATRRAAEWAAAQGEPVDEPPEE